MDVKGCLKRLCETGVMSNFDNPDTLRARVIKEISESTCNEPDKRKMIIQLGTLTTCESIQVYVFNAMLRFNKLGVIGRRNPS